MQDQDLQWLLEQLIGTAELLGQQMTPTAAAMLADDLSAYPRELLAKALARVRTEHTGRLTPKAILDRIDEVMGRPAANEAWALASRALDERETVVWTSEMDDAWALARPLAAEGDMVGARMAFIAAYERAVRTAREERRLPVVRVSMGWDAKLREVAVQKAVERGLLSSTQGQEYAQPALVNNVFNPVALLAGRIEPAPNASPEVRARLAQLRDEIAQRAGRTKRRAMAQARLERIRTVRQKAQITAEVEKRLAQEGRGHGTDPA